MCHELGHIFGAPDFYDTNYEKGGGDYESVERLDLMANGNKNNNRHSPAHPNPWLKCYLWKWNTVQELTGTNQVYNLYPTETSNNQVYRLSTAGGDYYLLENKQQDHLGSNGLFIYHVHSDMNDPGSHWNIIFNCANTRHPQRLYVVDPHSTTSVPTKDVSSYGDYYTNRSFTNPNNPKPFFTSTTTPYNLGWSGKPLSSKKDITMIRQETINGVNVVKFVLNPTIAGDTKFCDDEYFKVENVPYGADVSWGEKNANGTQSTMRIFAIEEDTYCKALYNRIKQYNVNNGSVHYPTGPAFVTASVTMNGHTYSLPDKPVNMTPMEQVKFSGPSLLPSPYWLPGQTRTYTVKNPIGDGSAVMWLLEGSAMHSTKSFYGKKSVQVTPDKYGTLKIRVIDGDGCSPFNETYEEFSIQDIQIMIQRNPTSGQATMTAYLLSETGTSGGDIAYAATVSSAREEYMGAYRIELWHERFGRVRAMDVAANTPTTHLDLTGLAPDQYTVRLIVDNQLRHTAQLIIR